MVGQGGPGKPRKKRSLKPEDPAAKKREKRQTCVYAPAGILDKLAAAQIPYGVAFLDGALFKLSQRPGVRTLKAVDREIQILDAAIFDFLEKKEKLLEERERLISGAIQEAETQKTEALE